MNGGLHVGYWSPNAETWFQNRLDLIRNDVADLKTAAKWRDALKFQRRTNWSVQGNQAAASLFLRSHEEEFI